MEKFFQNSIVDAYAEMCLGAMILRTPETQKLVKDKYPKQAIKSSYTHLSKDLIINGTKLLSKIANEGIKGSSKLRDVFTQTNRIFVIAMWDILKSTKKFNEIEKEPDIEFFRHIRNGCAHNGKFEIYSPLKYPAKWRNKEIFFNLNGTTIFPDFLADGDVYLLLSDINEKYFK